MKLKLQKLAVMLLALIMVLTPITVLPTFANSSTQITSDAYTIDHQKGLIFIPQNTTASEVIATLNNSDVSITDESGNVLYDSHALSGMNLLLNVDGGETLCIIIIGDANLDGKLLVTDLIRAAENAVGNKSEEGNNFEAMDVNRDSRITVSDVVLARKYILQEKLSGYYVSRAYYMNNLSYTVIGREVANNKGTTSESVTLQASSGGIEFLVDSVGDIKLTLQPNKAQYVSVVVDGAESEINLTSTSQTQVTVASGLKKGMHKVALYTQIEGGNVTVSGVTLTGKVLDADEKDLTIEFIGDSITAAFGNIYQTNDGDKIPGTVPSVQVGTQDRHQNGFLGYASIVGRTLDANFSVMAQSGSALMHNAVDPGNGGAMACMQDVYNTKKVNQFQNGKKADITIVALGGNDSKALGSVSTNREQKINHFKNEAMQFARAIVAENGENAKVVFYQSGGLDYPTYYGTSRPNYFNAISSASLIKEAYKRAVDELKQEGIKAYQVPDLPCDLRGLYVHPLVDGEGGHRDIANRMVTFLKENVIND